LLLEQINFEFSSKEEELKLDYDARINDLTTKLERKEYLM